MDELKTTRADPDATSQAPPPDLSTPRRPPQAPFTGLPTSVRDLAYVFFKWKWDITFVFLIGIVAAVVYLWIFRDNVYESSAKLLVKLGQEQAPPTTMLDDQPLLISQRPQDVNSEIDILTSTNLLQQVVDDLNLDVPSPPDPVPAGLLPRIRYTGKRYKERLTDAYEELMIRLGVQARLSAREEAVSALATALEVEALPESNVLVATLRTPEREGTARILNAIIDAYLAFRTDVYAGNESIGFFRSQLAATEGQLQQAEAELAAFEEQHGIQHLQAQEGLLLDKLEDTRQRLNEAEIAYSIAQMKLKRLEEVDPDDSADFSQLGEFDQGSFPEKLMLDLATLSKEREELQEQAGADLPLLRKIERQRRVVLGMLNNYLHALEAERREQYASLKALHDDLRAQLDGINRAETAWNEKKRTVKVAEENFLFYRAKLEESTAVGAMKQQQIGNVSVVQHAIDPFQPTGINKLKLLLVALVFAGLAAVAWAGIREYFDHTINTPEELHHHLSAPVIGAVPVWRCSSDRYEA